MKDLDISVVGDAPALAERLADSVSGRLTVHHRFGTATVVSQGVTVDLVTARRETYRQPGALPDVLPGDIADDLARRDFTVNAMALPLTGSDTRLVDPHGGRADLDAGIIRTLHPGSFRDDPTRMMRAVRYSSRLDFQLADTTVMELQHALAANALSTISADRIRHELDRISARNGSSWSIPTCRKSGRADRYSSHVVRPLLVMRARWSIRGPVGVVVRPGLALVPDRSNVRSPPA